MSWTDDVTFDIELPNGEVWRITYAWAARLIATAKYPVIEDDSPGSPDYEEGHFEERWYYIKNPEEAVHDLQGAVDWPEIREHAEQIEQTDDVDYHAQWMGADVSISKDRREERDET